MNTREILQLTTENINDRSQNLDQLSTSDILQCMNQEDREVPLAVSRSLGQIQAAVDLIAARMRSGGRLFYVGADTSGRIGALDAYECPPTFGTDPSLVQAVLAGGLLAQNQASEEAEDNFDQGKIDLERRNLSRADVVLGISASGRTPYVAGALKYARQTGASTVAFSCNEQASISELADVAKEVVTGPEVLTGSTRLKAGTAQKLVLNMISTATMVQLGKVYRNYMVDLQASNDKLRIRAMRIVQLATDAEEAEAQLALQQSGYNAKISIVMLLANVKPEEAQAILALSGNRVRDALVYHRTLIGQ